MPTIPTHKICWFAVCLFAGFAGCTGGTDDPKKPERDAAVPAEDMGAGDPTDQGKADDQGAEAGCGDGVLGDAEVCDGDLLNGVDCVALGFASGSLSCAAGCDRYDTTLCVMVSCGDGVVQTGEECDGTDLGGQTCGGLGFDGGELSCDNGCRWERSACAVPEAWTCAAESFGSGSICDCGCGVVDPDCADETAASCDERGCGGPGSCTEGGDCATVDPSDNSQCTSVCGDGVVDADEVCDGASVGAETCEALGYGAGTLGCSVDCLGFDTSACGSTTCGDGIIAGDEQCEGADLGGETCVSLGAAGGTLECNERCEFVVTDCDAPASWTCGPGVYGDGFCDCGCGARDADCADGNVTSCEECNFRGSCAEDFTGCHGIDATDNSKCVPSTCGNGTLEGYEICDGADLDGRDCVSVGFSKGSLGCTSSCELDTTSCSSTCGDQMRTAGEPCDGPDVRSFECNDFGYDSGTVGCDPLCTRFDLSACQTSAVCGDGVMEGPEACDGTDLGGAGCVSLGFTGGTLKCETDCSTFRLGGCTGNSIPGWTCAPDYYGDSICDCGCGIVDVDCVSAMGRDCHVCGGPGSCGTTAVCPGDIDPTNNAVCVSL